MMIQQEAGKTEYQKTENLKLSQSGRKLLEHCTLCPRSCGVNRIRGEKGRCRQTAQIFAARAALHMWEEPCISGTDGSGAVFFSGCALGCVFCQNQEISEGRAGKEITVARLSEIFLELQAQKAGNINLVTACQFAPQVCEALRLAKQEGLAIPIVYNSSGYENPETLQRFEGLVDIYLPDLKYLDTQLALRYSHAKDYPDAAQDAIAEMVRQQPEPVFDERGMMRKGVIVRHLLLPGHVREARHVVRYLYETYGNQIYISLMSQYTPMRADFEDPLLCRKVTKREYQRLIDYACELGVTQGFWQDGDTARESFVPAFDETGI